MFCAIAQPLMAKRIRIEQLLFLWLLLAHCIYVCIITHSTRHMYVVRCARQYKIEKLLFDSLHVAIAIVVIVVVVVVAIIAVIFVVSVAVWLYVYDVSIEIQFKKNGN